MTCNLTNKEICKQFQNAKHWSNIIGFLMQQGFKGDIGGVLVGWLD